MQRRRGFSLIELMIVIAIIGMLIGMLTPVLRSSTETTRRVSCRANLGAMGMILNSYAMSNKTFLPAPYVPADAPHGAVPFAMQYDTAVTAEQGAAIYTILRDGYQMDERILKCPTKPETFWIEPTNTAGFESPNWRNAVLTSFMWVSGMADAPYSVLADDLKSGSPTKANQPTWIMAADIAMEMHEPNGAESTSDLSPAIYNHDTNDVFEGGNVLKVSGEALWWDRDDWLNSKTGTAGTETDTFIPGAAGNGMYFDGEYRTYWWPAYGVTED